MNKKLTDNLEVLKKRDTEQKEQFAQKRVVMNEEVTQSLRIALELLRN